MGESGRSSAAVRHGHWLVRAVVATFILCSVLCFSHPPGAKAHGIWAHVHVTGWAIEALPEGELREFFKDEELLNAAHFGAAFTDSGYWPQGGELQKRGNAYSEHIHWEPFVEEFIHWVRANDPPPWTTQDSKKRVAFLLGIASHGLQDEIFDSLFLYQVEEHDGAGQDEADPASDGALVHEGKIRFMPTQYIPFDTLLEVFENTGLKVEAEDIQDCVDIMNFLYLNDGPGQEVALSMYEEYHAKLPWSFAHFFDPDIPGSIESEIAPTAAYMEAVWKRLHAKFGEEDLLAHTYPGQEGTVLGTNHESVDSWVTFIFGMGVNDPGPLFATLSDDAGTELPVKTTGTRWGTDRGRLHRYMPQDDLVPGTWYNLTVPPGITLVDGTTTTEPMEVRFQAPCDPAPCAAEEPPPETVAEPDEESPERESGCTSGTSHRNGGICLLAALLWLAVTRRKRGVVPSA